MLTARDIARITNGQLSGNPDEPVTGVAAIHQARPGDVTFLAAPKYRAAAKTTRASVLIVAHDTELDCPCTVVRVENPSLAFARVVEHLSPPPPGFKPGVDPTAVIAPTAKLGRDVSIQPFVVIEDGATIGDRTVIGAGSYIGHHCRIGADCLIYARVCLREHTVLGERVTLHCGVVLGADGFGYETVAGKHVKIPQRGHVEIGDDVEIGANTTIDRGRFGKTSIGRGTKIDNLVQIGHNCSIGEDCIICAAVGIAGSTTIGNRVVLAGQVGVAGHLSIGDGAVIMAQAGVTKEVPAGAVMLGAPAMPHNEFKRITAAMHRLPELAAKLRELQQQLAELRAATRSNASG